MNHIYRSIWSQALGTWVAVSEYSKSQGKGSNTRRKLLVTGLLICSSPSWALPTDGQVVAGQVGINTPAAGQMQIDQASQKAIVNWQGFSIAHGESVNINQPNAQATMLNRVVGQDASQIQGQLHANGQVYLVNPNGVIFGKTAQVDVGGLVATTHNISNKDFLDGKNHFTQDGAKGSVENHGTITTPDGGVVALIGESVTNTGTINTPKGTTALAAGKTVDLDFKGDGLVEVKVSEAALNAQITNKGAIQADGGRIAMTAKAANSLIDTVINQDGIVRAQGLIERNGEIILDGGNTGITQVSGTLDTSSQQTGGKISVTGNEVKIQSTANIDASGNAGGGTVVIGDKLATQQTTIQQGANVNAQALDHGKAGTINVFANMNNGTVNVAGQLNASAPQNGDGGFIDTSAAHVKIADSAKISTKASHGKSGTWIIDPVDFTIAATGGDISGSVLSSNLGLGNVTIFSTSGVSGVNGDVNVNDVVTWVANSLTLNALRNININANLNASGTAKLALQYGQASATGGANDNYIIKNEVSITLPVGANLSTQKGTVGTVINYTVINTLNDLQAVNSGLNLNYALNADIDATVTSTWNSNAGFVPIGNLGAAFTGHFDGLGHTISNLTINRPTTDYIGLFGATEVGSSISNIGLLGGNIAGQYYTGALVGGNLGIINNAYATSSVTGTYSNVGGLVGLNDIGGNINNAYATGNVNGSDVVGGLVGNNSGNISNAYATGNVNGTSPVTTLVGGLVGDNSGTISSVYATGHVSGIDVAGGLLGNNNGTIIDAYATGSVSGTNDIGGLVGTNNGNIENTYATGAVSGTTNVGGLAGSNFLTFINSFWNTQSNGAGSGSTAGMTASTTAEMQQFATFDNAKWNISNTGGSSAVWRIYEGNTMPLLTYWLKPLTVDANIIEVYNGLIHNSLDNASYSDPGAVTSGHLFYTANPFGNAINVGNYPLTGQLYSDQQGYDITVVSPSVLTIIAPPIITPPPESAPQATDNTPNSSDIPNSPDMFPIPVVTVSVIKLELTNLMDWIFQLTPMQLSSTFLYSYQTDLNESDDVDADYGQHKRDTYELKTVTYEARREYGKRQWREKKHDRNQSRYTRLLIQIENLGMKLPKGLQIKF